jgi:hypothetical protein
MFDAFVERKNGFNFPLWVSLLSWLFGWILRSKLMWVSLNIGLLILKSHGISRFVQWFLIIFQISELFFRSLLCFTRQHDRTVKASRSRRKKGWVS